MKTSIFLFSFILILISDATAQIDTADFFPMQKGNYWLYYYQDFYGWDYMEMTVMGDTLIHCRRYVRFHQNFISAYGTDSKDLYFRKDSNEVYIFNDSLGEYKYFDLRPGIASGTFWETYKNSKTNCILGRQVYCSQRLAPGGNPATRDSMDWPPNCTRTRSFAEVLINPATNEIVPGIISDKSWSLLQGIGLIGEQITFGLHYKIRGAIIYGVKLGNTTIGPLTSVKAEENIAPGSMSVQAYPNPFNSTTRLNVQLKSAGMTELMLFNAIGQKVATIFEGHKPSGNFTFSFNADHLTSGIYFVILKQGSFFSKEKIILLK